MDPPALLRPTFLSHWNYIGRPWIRVCLLMTAKCGNVIRVGDSLQAVAGWRSPLRLKAKQTISYLLGSTKSCHIELSHNLNDLSPSSPRERPWPADWQLVTGPCTAQITWWSRFNDQEISLIMPTKEWWLCHCGATSWWQAAPVCLYIHCYVGPAQLHLTDNIQHFVWVLRMGTWIA